MLGKSEIAIIVIVVALSAVGAASLLYDGASVEVYTDGHVDVSRDSDFLGRTVLKATVEEGFLFDGWYDEDGKLLSEDVTYSAYMSDGQIVYASSLRYVTVEIGGTVDLSGYITISDVSKLTVGPSDFDGSTPGVSGTKVTTTNPGVYMCVYFDKDAHIRTAVAIMTDGIIQKTFEWTYSTSIIPVFDINPFKPASRDNEFKLTIGILYSDYVHYTSIYTDGKYARWGKITESHPDADDIAHDVAYVRYDTVQDKYIDRICDYIASATEGKSQQYVANVALAFTQAIDYKSDMEVHGVEEYWQFPLETLFLSSGDCEDSSILFCAIAERMGLDTCYFLYSGHMTAGIYLEDFTAPTRTSSSIYNGAHGWYVETGKGPDGEPVELPFYCCETTNKGWQIGEIPASEYDAFRFGIPINTYLPGTDLDIVCSDGVTVSTVSSGGRTTLVATTKDGTEFTGWFDAEGNLLSESTTYSGKFSDGDRIYAAGGPGANPDRHARVGEATTLEYLMGPTYSKDWHVVQDGIEEEGGYCVFLSSGNYVISDGRTCDTVYIYPLITIYAPSEVEYAVSIGGKGISIDVTVDEGSELDGLFTRDEKISDDGRFYGNLENGEEVYILIVEPLNRDFPIGPAETVDLGYISGIREPGTWEVMTAYFETATGVDLDGQNAVFNNPGTYIVTFKGAYDTWCSTISIDRSGTYYTFDINGWTLSQSILIPVRTPIYGTMTSEYVAHNIQHDDYLIHQIFSFSSGVNGESYSWSSDNDLEDYTETYLGTRTIQTAHFGTKDCAVWELGYKSSGYKVTETQYVDLETSAVYSINVDYRYGTTVYIHYDYVLTTTGTKPMDIPSADLEAYADEGLSVTVETEGRLGDDVVLNAVISDGTVFEGWYDDSFNLLSTDTGYIMRSGTVHTVYAVSEGNSPVMTGIPVDLRTLFSEPLPAGGTWSAVDYEGGAVPETKVSITDGIGTFSELGGRYVIRYADETTGTYRMVSVLIDGVNTVNITWTYDDCTYSLDLDILFSDYVHYVDASPAEDRVSMYRYYIPDPPIEGLLHDMSFVHLDDVQTKYISTIADYIRTSTEGMTDQQVANVILRFCQASVNPTPGIAYVSDRTAHGVEEYWQYPLETLYLKAGDCEDTSFLFAAVASYMGFDTCMFVMTGHMAPGIALDTFTPTPGPSPSISESVYGMEVDGTMYYYCETTNNTWFVGNVWTAEFVEAFGTAYALPEYD